MRRHDAKFARPANFLGRSCILCRVEADFAVSDAELVQLARRGEVAALGALLERHRAALYARALSVLGDRSAAQDAVQDTFVVALGRLGELREPAAAGAWLRAIVRNACLAQVRRNREVPGDVPDRGGDPDFGPEAALERMAVRDWVLSTLEQLPVDQRATVMLRYFTRLSSYAYISAVLGIPIGTVRSRLNDAKRRLADALLEVAAAGHADHGKLADERWSEWTGAVEDMERYGSAARYFASCADDVVVENSSGGYRELGAATERRNVENGLALGVRLRPTGIVASPGITIFEADYDNPPEHPGHCPPLHTEIRIHPRGVTTRLILHFGAQGLG
jgi:RNA polymerase sigma factor (sigma-70 family)